MRKSRSTKFLKNKRSVLRKQKGGGSYKFNLIYKDYIYPIQVSPMSITTYLQLFNKLIQEIKKRISGLPRNVKIVIPFLDTKYLYNELKSEKTEINVIIDPKLQALLRSSSRTQHYIPVHVSDARKDELESKPQLIDTDHYQEMP